MNILRRRPLLPFLLLATLALDIVILPNLDRSYRIAAPLAQVGLLGIWAGQLRRGWTPRLVIAFAGMVVAALCVRESPPRSEVLTVFITYGVGIAVVSLLSRLVGRIIRKLRGKATKPVQFSMAGILITMTMVAVAATLWRWADWPNDDLYKLAILLGSWGLLPLMSYELVRRTPSVGFAFGGVMLLSVLSALPLRQIVGPPINFFSPTLAQGVFIAIWLLGLRVRRRYRKKTSSTDPASSKLQIHNAAETETAESLEELTQTKIDLEA